MNIRRNSAAFFTFLTKLSSILTKFSSMLLKYFKIVNCSEIDFISKDEGRLLNCWNGFFFKIQTLFVEKMAFLAQNLLEVHTIKLRLYSS